MTNERREERMYSKVDEIASLLSDDLVKGHAIEIQLQNFSLELYVTPMGTRQEPSLWIGSKGYCLVTVPISTPSYPKDAIRAAVRYVCDTMWDRPDPFLTPGELGCLQVATTVTFFDSVASIGRVAQNVQHPLYSIREKRIK